MLYKTTRVVAAGLLFWAIPPNPYGYYTFLRIVVCGVAAFTAYFSYEIKKEIWAVVFGMIAILFNPISPISLSREIWAPIDIGTGILFIISTFFIKIK